MLDPVACFTQWQSMAPLRHGLCLQALLCASTDSEEKIATPRCCSLHRMLARCGGVGSACLIAISPEEPRPVGSPSASRRMVALHPPASASSTWIVHDFEAQAIRQLFDSVHHKIPQ
ncbi:uncharacterized protein CC84DRAFT_790702 [Paraphaeosphaeria sporulosa]|uniref:Uncharacterized protein n=1 Tax=Paraphaeosphaeria sporulosa TaxID=1460663 RepID=A0A177CC76_9PLEO|nr:uncharacterized protein CC84DRAFT_790702 [Paraphaeosphaeria sporulosa]OAG04368.1 hypothetical protein CC84DRAFT_790702 [Paraphaeosphaeria sporulosa]